MPLYDYKCGKCGKVFEVRQSFSDPVLTTHEECGGAVERLISTPALQFKGTGWYITDYARSGSGSSKPAENGSRPEGKTETKTSETKSDTSSGSSAKGTTKSE